MDKYEYDYSKLKGRVKEKCGTQTDFAHKIGRSSNYISNVFCGRTYFSQKDIACSSVVLEIEPQYIGEYFFCQKSSQKRN